MVQKLINNKLSKYNKKNIINIILLNHKNKNKIKKN